MVAAGTPCALFAWLRRHSGVSYRPMWVGAAAFVTAVFIVESPIHMLVLKTLGLINKTAQPFTYAIYGAMMAGVFEETARWLAFRWLYKKNCGSGISTGLAYGIGHGGTEAAVVGVVMIVNLVVSIIINNGGASALPAALQTAGDALAAAPPYMFLVSALERLSALVIQISLSVMVFCAVFRRAWRLFPFAILLHAAVDFPAALAQAGVIKSVALLEGYVALCAAGMAWLAWRIHKKLPDPVFQ